MRYCWSGIHHCTTLCMGCNHTCILQRLMPTSRHLRNRGMGPAAAEHMQAVIEAFEACLSQVWGPAVPALSLAEGGCGDSPTICLAEAAG